MGISAGQRHNHRSQPTLKYVSKITRNEQVVGSVPTGGSTTLLLDSVIKGMPSGRAGPDPGHRRLERSVERHHSVRELERATPLARWEVGGRSYSGAAACGCLLGEGPPVAAQPPIGRPRTRDNRCRPNNVPVRPPLAGHSVAAQRSSARAPAASASLATQAQTLA